MFRKRVKPNFVGAIDRLYPSDMAGWAVDRQGRPAPVTVVRNGETVATVTANQSRADLGRLGVSADCAFLYNFPEPLAPTDVVAILFPDGAPVPGADRPAYPERLRRLLTGIDPATMRGIELGALDRPVLSKKRGPVLYVDHAPTDALKLKYAHTPRSLVDLDRIVEVDVVWSGGPLLDRLPGREPVDYCIASHVVEHVADPLGWLKGLAGCLTPGGLVSLAIPERSRTFDHRREVTRPADLVESFLLRPTRPTPRQVFDCLAFHAPLGADGDDRDAAERFRHAYAMAELAATTDTYLDVHCTVWTAESFREAWAVVRRLDLVPLAIAALFEPQDGADDFIVVLRKTGPA